MKNKRELALYRLNDSKEKLNASKILFKNGSYKDSVSRSYYAMFTSARALLATKSLDSAKHSGVISLFNLHFVKAGIVGKEYGKLLAEAKNIREESDYGDFVIVSKEEGGIQIKHAEQFIKEIEKAI
ncbi:MAG: HEPN domain-containing protein [bacterium]